MPSICYRYETGRRHPGNQKVRIRVSGRTCPPKTGRSVTEVEENRKNIVFLFPSGLYKFLIPLSS